MEGPNVTREVEAYICEKPFLEKHLHSEAGHKVLSMIAERRESVSTGYWHRFGYEFAGPVCYAFVKWIADTLDKQYPMISNVAFIARDGYILQKIYKQLSVQSKRKMHYIYAPRSVAARCKKTGDYASYREYLEGEGLTTGNVAIVDTVTMRFSAQKLIETALSRPVHGFYWAVLQEAAKEGKNLAYCTFQKEKYHVIRAWNIMEFVMTSPERPVKELKGGLPVYYEPNDFESERVRIFKEIEQGTLDFISDLCETSAELPSLSEEFIVEWINDFLENPSSEDLDAFKDVMFSMEADHSDSIPLAPFQTGNAFSPPSLLDKVWFYSQQHPRLYSVLHAGKSLLKSFGGE